MCAFLICRASTVPFIRPHAILRQMQKRLESGEDGVATDHPRPRGPEYDLALKSLLEAAHDGFLALIAPGASFLQSLPTELPASARVADLVWEVICPAWDAAEQATPASERMGLLHIELQTSPDRDIGERVAEYGLHLARRERIARGAQQIQVRSIVVLLRPTAAIPISPYVISWGSQQSYVCNFDIIRLWELPPTLVLDTDHYQLWPLASLMGGVTQDSTIAIARRLAEAPLPRAERGELLGLLVALAGVRLPKIDVRSALKEIPMLDELLRESSFYDVVYEEGFVEGEARGETRGVLDGLRVVLESRFGALPEDVSAALAALEQPALMELLQHVATDTLEQVRARLGLA